MLSALHPQVAWYGRGDISSTFASTYKITTPVEGHINRLKLIKRQAYGRAGLFYLQRRFLPAA